MVDGEGSKPGSVSSAGAIPGGTGSGMKEHAGDVGTFTTRRNRALRHSWYHHYMAPSHPGVTVSSSNMEPESTLIRPSASTAATSYVPFSVMPIHSNPGKSFEDETSSSSGLAGNERIILKIADLGDEQHFKDNIQTQQYHCLGVMLDAK
ncbi:hypothetical protein PILCRDRAFT_14357 [Piloderma croceum F 1598]|uniref:Uncharacterized protein n=1 Tax=Piloderma croceum (strain F 1598) TaxID=765440 RepID=A0A0C3F3Y6_PILCF|nr:hypothetical protein PILCRDRAFT_14357 [Piloderma croceum F 1598]